MTGRLSTRVDKLEEASGDGGIEIVVVKDGEAPVVEATRHSRRGRRPIRVFISEDDAKL
jgi:hypothetical protein